MKVIEKYPAGLRMFMGKGGWLMLSPLRYMLSMTYRTFLFLSGDRIRSIRRSERSSNRSVTETPFPVIISIGNLEVGGGGKTPCTIALAENIRKMGGEPVIITRGYGSLAEKAGKSVVILSGTGKAGGNNIDYLTLAELMDSQGMDGSDEDRVIALGDEVMLYRDRGFSVIIDPERKRAVALAKKLFSPSHILLDDAFQRRDVERDVDLLLLDQKEPFGNGWILPAGRLREPSYAVERADAVIFTRAVDNEVPGKARKLVEGKKVYFAKHVITGLRDRSGEPCSFSVLENRDIVLYSGIARPESFERNIRNLCVDPVLSLRFPDHHPYSRGDIDYLMAQIPEEAVIITTEKDRLKSFRFFPGEKEIYFLEIRMVIDGTNRAWNRKRPAGEGGPFDIDSILITR